MNVPEFSKPNTSNVNWTSLYLVLDPVEFLSLLICCFIVAERPLICLALSPAIHIIIHNYHDLIQWSKHILRSPILQHAAYCIMLL